MKQVAAYLQLHEVTVMNFARKGLLPAFKVGREWRFRADFVREWLEYKALSQEERNKRFNDLWKRIRKGLEAAGYGPNDVDRLIQEVREERRKSRQASHE